METYHLVTYVKFQAPWNQELESILLIGTDPVEFLSKMDKDTAYPIAISNLTKEQFDVMTKSFPSIQIKRQTQDNSKLSLRQ